METRLGRALLPPRASSLAARWAVVVFGLMFLLN